ncbi:MAG TPA: DMT family transporter [Bacteroidetes bacterium]|nr:DMT family transporter [Bacteroidota bacterium]
MKRKLFFVYTGIILAMIFWALSFIWFKMANEHYPPITIVMSRLILSSVLLYIFTKTTGTLQVLQKKDRSAIVLLTLFNPFLYFIGESYGLTYVSSTIGAVIISTIPLFTPFAAHYFLKERLSRMNYLGIFLSFAGVLLILYHPGGWEVSWKGVLFLLFAVFCAIAYTILLTKLSFRYNALSLITWQNALGAFLFIPLFLWIDLPSLPSDIWSWHYFRPILELAVFASSFSFVLFAVGIKVIGAARTNIFSNIIPAFTAIFAFFLLQEPLTFQKGAGILIVIGGLFLSQIRSTFFKRLMNRISGIPYQE